MTQRRLAAILAADVVDYSRLVSADEAGALGCAGNCFGQDQDWKWE